MLERKSKNCAGAERVFLRAAFGGRVQNLIVNCGDGCGRLCICTRPILPACGKRR